MKKTTLKVARILAAGAIMATAAFGYSQTTTTVTAKFASQPAAGQDFSVDLANAGSADIAGFAFKLLYDPAQVSVQGVSDNTGQADAGMQYTLGAETASSNPALPAQRILTATTIKDLKQADDLVEIKFAAKAGYAAPLKLQIEDRVTEPLIDGLQGSSLKNLPHTFDTSQVNK